MAGFDWISLCTDYGYVDGFVAACHGVMARIAPQARVLDVTHAIGPGDVRHGSVVLADTLPWLPPAVHVGVVDPGVGTDRRAIAVVAGPSLLLGPDNGLLLAAAGSLGGIAAAYVLTNDLRTAIRMAEGLEYGIIGINDTVPATAQAPFGGMKESGLGREGSHEGLEAYLETKYIALAV